MKMTTLTIAAITICGLMFGTTADATPFTGLEDHEVIGLHKVLRKFRVKGAVSKEVNGGGSLVRTRFNVTGCPKMPDAFAESWSCFASIRSTFRIKGKYHQGVSVLGGAAQVISSADGDKMIFEEQVEYAWDAEDQLLHVLVTYASPATGVVKRWGTYNVRARTAQKITTQTNKFDANASLKDDVFDLGFNLTKTESRKTAKMRITIEGSPWYGETGHFTLQRLPFSNETVFITQMDWLTDAEIDYEEEAPVVTTSCSGSFTANGTANFNFQTESGSITAGSAETVDCRITSEALTAKVHWRAKPSFTDNDPDGVGQATFNRIVVRKLSASHRTAHYQAGFNSLINWSLDVETANGVTLGGGFEVSSTQGPSEVLKPPVYSTTF